MNQRTIRINLQLWIFQKSYLTMITADCSYEAIIGFIQERNKSNNSPGVVYESKHNDKIDTPNLSENHKKMFQL